MTFIPRLSRRSFVRAAVLLHKASVEVMRPTCFHLKHRLHLQQENMVLVVFNCQLCRFSQWYWKAWEYQWKSENDPTDSSNLISFTCWNNINSSLYVLNGRMMPHEQLIEPWPIQVKTRPVLLPRSDAVTSLLTNSSKVFNWELNCHWLIALWQHQIAAVIRGPAIRVPLGVSNTLTSS